MLSQDGKGIRLVQWYFERERENIHLTVITLYRSEKAMATHSSVLAWRIPGTGEPGGLPSVGLHRVGHD